MKVKQRITVYQLQELNEAQKERLREWWKPREGDFVAWNNSKSAPFGWRVFVATPHDMQLIYKGGHYPLLSIGQMIEFLQNSKTDWTLNGSTWDDPIICDFLWNEVKKILKDTPTD